MTHARRAGLGILLALIGAGVNLAVLPALPATVRWHGVALLWWYGLVLAPAAGALVTIYLAQRSSPVPAVGLWAGPALLLPLAAQVFAGGPAAPLAAVVAVLAPFVAVLAPVRGEVGLPRPFVAAVVCVAAGLLAAAHLRAAAEAAATLGVPTWLGLAVSATAAAAALVLRSRGACEALLVAGVLALAGVVVGVALGAGMTPAAAWRRAASRPAVVFPDESPWLTGGGVVRAPTTLVVREPQRLVAASAATWQVRDRDDESGLRDWRLSAGDSIALRPGDAVSLPAGARVKFESGRRVPGAPPSGPAWADGPVRTVGSAALSALGTAVTLTPGAAALLGRAAAGGLLTMPVAATAVLLAAAGGLYAAAAAPDLGLGGPSVACFVGLPAAAVPGLGGRVLTVVMVLGLALLLAAALAPAADLGRRAWSRRGREPRRWSAGVAVVAGGLLLSSAPVAPGRLLALGLGLAGAVLVPPALVRGTVPRRVAGFTGLGAFVALAGAAAVLAVPAPVGDAPALVAVPLGWAAGWVAAGRR
jgi:hypothetical protein